MGGSSWGGSEELWSRAALALRAQGWPVAASVVQWSPLHPRIGALRAAGVEVHMRRSRHAMLRRALHQLAARQISIQVVDIARRLRKWSPALVVISDGGVLPPIELLEFCNENRLPFVTIGQANDDRWWPEDGLAHRYRDALGCALRCYFVSRANWRLTEKQIGAPLPNAEIVWNPFNVDFGATPAWPASEDDEVRFASVARLHPPSKGQDILLEVLASPPWKHRRWRLCLYGEGPMRDGLERLAESLGISHRVVFEGHRPIEQVWALNHVLVMPSRYEGLPLAMVEAMLCGRLVIATDVAGHREIIEDGCTGFLADAPTVASMDQALERFWTRRFEAEEIGKKAARQIRRLIPADPACVFAQKLKQLMLQSINQRSPDE